MLSKNYTRPQKNAKLAFFYDGDDWLHSSQLSSDINTFAPKEKQTIYIIQGFVGTGAFIWEDNIAGRVFPFGTINRFLNWRSFMMNFEEKPIVKGVLFMSSMKSQENVEQMVMKIKVQCTKKNILVGDVAVNVIKLIKNCIYNQQNILKIFFLKKFCFFL